MLSDAERRAKLYKRIDKHLRGKRFDGPHHFLADVLYRQLESKFSESLPELKTVCDYTRERYYLSMSRFCSWLPTVELKGDRTRHLALFACSFAILQQSIATDLLLALVDWDTGFEVHLLVPLNKDLRNRCDDPPIDNSLEQAAVRHKLLNTGEPPSPIANTAGPSECFPVGGETRARHRERPYQKR